MLGGGGGGNVEQMSACRWSEEKDILACSFAGYKLVKDSD